MERGGKRCTRFIFIVTSKGGDLWELRPIRDRIFFVAWHEGSFVLLHHFMKKTVKTPPREIEQARRELADLKERGVLP